MGLSVATSDCLYEWIIDSFPQPIHLSDLAVILEHTRWIICSTDSFEDTDCSATNHSESFKKKKTINYTDSFRNIITVYWFETCNL